MSSTPRLGLPLIEAGQAQKHVTHNEALARLDALVQASVASRRLAGPPSDPADGTAWIVAASPTGAWSGEAGSIAARIDGAWTFLTPRAGWVVWVADEAGSVIFTGSRWATTGELITSLAGLVGLGVGTTADGTNRLAVKSDAVLLSHDDVTPGSGDVRIVVNKAAAARTVSFLFQDAYSGRAEIGLSGDDDLHVKVSADGSSWTEAVSIARATGGVSFGRPDLARTALGLDACGFRNRIRNPSFAINQRGKTGTIVLAAGAYGHDGVKAGANGATYTASTAGLDTTLTITAGSLILPIEYVLIEGGSYVLSQAGTAPARVWQGTGTSGSGSYAAAPFAVTGLAAATQTDVEFGVGTVLRPQFEPGTLATAFERRPTAIELELCQRYFQKSYSAGVAPGTATAVGAAVTGSPTVNAYSLAAGYLPVEMRAVPTVVYYALNGEPGKVSYWTTGLNPTTSFTSGPGNSSRAICAQLVNVTDATMIYFHYTASAEI
jgi:hypothetical protein